MARAIKPRPPSVAIMARAIKPRPPAVAIMARAIKPRPPSVAIMARAIKPRPPSVAIMARAIKPDRSPSPFRFSVGVALPSAVWLRGALSRRDVSRRSSGALVWRSADLNVEGGSSGHAFPGGGSHFTMLLRAAQSAAGQLVAKPGRAVASRPRRTTGVAPSIRATDPGGGEAHRGSHSSTDRRIYSKAFRARDAAGDDGESDRESKTHQSSRGATLTRGLYPNRVSWSGERGRSTYGEARAATLAGWRS